VCGFRSEEQAGRFSGNGVTGVTLNSILAAAAAAMRLRKLEVLSELLL
jgi:hypothetical protein